VQLVNAALVWLIEVRRAYGDKAAVPDRRLREAADADTERAEPIAGIAQLKRLGRGGVDGHRPGHVGDKCDDHEQLILGEAFSELEFDDVNLREPIGETCEPGPVGPRTRRRPGPPRR
jgi:hypothetical protein